MIPVVCFVGRSGAGKTTVVEKVIRELVRRGKKVAAVKHAHAGFQWGLAGKDSERLAAAGASPVLLLAPDKYSLTAFTPQELPLSALLPLVSDCDMAIAEGFKGSAYPKVEVHRGGQGLMLPEESLAAVVTDAPLDVRVPQFGLDDVVALTDWVESRCAQEQPSLAVYLTVDGKQIDLKPFATSVLGRTILGAISALRGVEGVPHSVRLIVRRDTAD